MRQVGYLPIYLFESSMFRAIMCSSSGGQLYEYNFWYNRSVLVAVRYAGRYGIPSQPAVRMATNKE